MVGIKHVGHGIIADLESKLPWPRKTHRGKPKLLMATMLEGRSANPLVDVGVVILPYGRDVLARLGKRGARVGLMIDQSKAGDLDQMVRVFARVGGRALPLAWWVKETQGAIGFAEQREAFEALLTMLLDGITPVLMGDRFYGSPRSHRLVPNTGLGLAPAA